MAIENHPAASHIPRPPRNGQPAIVGNPDDLSELVYGPEVPKRLDDYLYSDRPQLGLRVISFKNSTVVVLHWIHLACDATAKRALLDAWMLMLRGKEDEIPEPLAPDCYALENIGKEPTTPHALANHHMSTTGLVLWLLRNAYSFLLLPKEHRMVCVPAAYLTKLREKALQDLNVQAISREQNEEPFLSEGDVLLAWITRLAMVNVAKDSERMVSTVQ